MMYLNLPRRHHQPLSPPRVVVEPRPQRDPEDTKRLVLSSFAGTLICHTTGRRYEPAWTTLDKQSGILWAACVWCDSGLKLRGQRGFSVRRPQWHPYRADGGAL